LHHTRGCADNDIGRQEPIHFVVKRKRGVQSGIMYGCVRNCYIDCYVGYFEFNLKPQFHNVCALPCSDIVVTVTFSKSSGDPNVTDFSPYDLQIQGAGGFLAPHFYAGLQHSGSIYSVLATAYR
jgi:hypothetical protein